MSVPRFVLFDLDGTVSDSEPGIVACLRLALAEHGAPPLGDAEARALLGPPFQDSLPPLVGADLVWPVIEAYRGHYRAGGMYDTSLYPGVAELLTALRDAGTRLAVATSKAEDFAAPILARLGVDEHFEAITGDTLDGARASKALVIAEALRRLGNPAPQDVLMVGDRRADVVGAAAHGIRCAGAGWGYGGVGELAQAGAFDVFPTADDLRAYLLGFADGGGERDVAAS